MNTVRHGEKMRRDLADKEENRKERKRLAEEKKLTFKCGFVQKKINNFMMRLPEQERKRYESKQETRP